jgi:adenosylcobyric acid synthase
MTPRAPCLMIQGTGSGVGKSVLTTALCRLFSRAGYRVAPFKAQNMALNAFVTDGGEIGRAQAAQAEAAGVEPSVDMNPVLLKPESDGDAQVIVRGVVRGRLSFREYAGMRDALLPMVSESLERLRCRHDLVLIEGAGSPAEINLREHDIANMPIAHLADAPVLLVSDIDRGGMFAALVGTLELLGAEDRRCIAGFVVNKFRGDVSLLTAGLTALEARTGLPVLGVIPHFGERLVPAEDSLDLEHLSSGSAMSRLDLAIVRLPRIANFDDFEPLTAEPGVRVRLARRPTDVDEADLVILPGSKSTMADLAWLREWGLAEAIVVAAARGRPILGICGGYQMLGETLRDPDHVESSIAEESGLGLLPVATTFVRGKTLIRITATGAATSRFFAGVNRTFRAYEIHSGRTEPATPLRRGRGGRPAFRIVMREGQAVEAVDGTVGVGRNVEGTYLHGMFASGEVRRSLLAWLARRKGMLPDPGWGADGGTDRYDRLADIVSDALDMTAVAKLVGLSYSHRTV